MEEAIIAKFRLSEEEERQFRLNIKSEKYSRAISDEAVSSELLRYHENAHVRALLTESALAKHPLERLVKISDAFVVLAVAAGKSPNEDFMGQTPLCAAVRTGSESLVSLLLDLGADPNRVPAISVTNLAFSPLHIAIRRGHHHIVELLLRRGVGINQVVSQTSPLGYAAQQGDCELVARFLDLGADPNLVAATQDYTIFTTPLEFAVGNQDRTMVELLLSRGADPNVRDELKTVSPFLRAIMGKDRDIARLLLAYGADWETCCFVKVFMLPADDFRWFIESSGYDASSSEGKRLIFIAKDLSGKRSRIAKDLSSKCPETLATNISFLEAFLM